MDGTRTIHRCINHTIAHQRSPKDSGNVASLQSFITVDDIEVYILTLPQGAEVAVERTNTRMVSKNVLSAQITLRDDLNESKTNLLVEPFHISDVLTVRTRGGDLVDDILGGISRGLHGCVGNMRHLVTKRVLSLSWILLVTHEILK